MNSIENFCNNIVDTLVKIIDKRDKKSNTLTYGTIKSVEPLKIEISNNIVLEETQLVLGQMCKPHKVRIPHMHTITAKTEDAISKVHGVYPEFETHKHDIKEQEISDVHKDVGDKSSVSPIGYEPKPSTGSEEYVMLEIYPKLKVGDKVLMFAFNDYQQYYVAERIEE